MIKRAHLSGNSYIQDGCRTRAERVTIYSKAWHSTPAVNLNRGNAGSGPPSLHTTKTLLLLLMGRRVNLNRGNRRTHTRLRPLVKLYRVHR